MTPDVPGEDFLIRRTPVYVVAAALLTATLIANAACAEKGHRPILLRGINLVDVRRGTIQRGVDVLVADGRVKAIGVHIVDSGDTQVIDAAGKYLIPGLWDMHVHLAGLAADPTWSRDVLLPLLIANGVTGVRDMGGDLSALRTWKSEIALGHLLGPQIEMVGPMLDREARDPSIRNVVNAQQARAALADLEAEHLKTVKVLSLDRDSYFAVTTEARRRRMQVVGHVPASVSSVEASNAGQRSIEHILYGNFAVSCSRREDQLRDAMDAAMRSGAILQVAKVQQQAWDSYDPARADRLWATLVRNRTWVVPTLVSTSVHSNLAELAADDPEVRYLPRSVVAEWDPVHLQRSLLPEKLAWYRGELERELAFVGEMHRHHVQILAGTDSLDTHNIVGGSLTSELELLVRAGLRPIDALRAATIDAARFLGRSDVGTIEVGKRADLVLLGGDPTSEISNVRRVESVVIGGKLLSRADLDALLAQLRSAAESR